MLHSCGQCISIHLFRLLLLLLLLLLPRAAALNGVNYPMTPEILPLHLRVRHHCPLRPPPLPHPTRLILIVATSMTVHSCLSSSSQEEGEGGSPSSEDPIDSEDGTTGDWREFRERLVLSKGGGTSSIPTPTTNTTSSSAASATTGGKHGHLLIVDGGRRGDLPNVDCSKGAVAWSLEQKVVLSFNGYWGKRSE